MYDIIFLDWYKTLSHSLFWGSWAKDPDFSAQLQLVQTYLFSGNNSLVDDWMRGRLDSEQVVNSINKNTGIEYQQIWVGLMDSAKCMQITDNRVLDNIKKIQSCGIKVIIATDNMDTFTRWTVPALALETYFDGILDSSSLGALKGDFDKQTSLFFQDFLNRSDIDPTRMLLIDDREEAAIVKSIGMNFLHFDGNRALSDVLGSLI